jgi:hypothetical protein
MKVKRQPKKQPITLVLAVFWMTIGAWAMWSGSSALFAWAAYVLGAGLLWSFLTGWRTP